MLSKSTFSTSTIVANTCSIFKMALSDRLLRAGGADDGGKSKLFSQVAGHLFGGGLAIEFIDIGKTLRVTAHQSIGASIEAFVVIGVVDGKLDGTLLYVKALVSPKVPENDGLFVPLRVIEEI